MIIALVNQDITAAITSVWRFPHAQTARYATMENVCHTANRMSDDGMVNVLKSVRTGGIQTAMEDAMIRKL